MRKPLLFGLAVVSLSGIAYAQDLTPERVRQYIDMARELDKLPKTCVDAAGVTRQVEETTALDGFEFRCVRTFGDRLRLKGADWVMVGPKK